MRRAACRSSLGCPGKGPTSRAAQFAARCRADSGVAVYGRVRLWLDIWSHAPAMPSCVCISLEPTPLGRKCQKTRGRAQQRGRTDGDQTTSLERKQRSEFRKSMLLFAHAGALASTDKKNVYGDELVTCSTASMAMTGFTRDGYCTECADPRAIAAAHFKPKLYIVLTTRPFSQPRRRCRFAPHVHHHVAQWRGPQRGRQLL